MKHVLTFISSLMMASFFYLLLAHLSPFQHNAPLPPNPWFALVLIGLVPATILGTMIVNWLSTWNTHEMLNRVSTGLVLVLTVVGLGETAWQNGLGSGGGALHLVVMLLLTSLAATIGTLSNVSERMIKSATWGMRRVRWLMIALAMLLGGTLGFVLTNGLASGWLTPIGVLLGLAVGALLVTRVDRLLKQKPHP